VAVIYFPSSSEKNLFNVTEVGKLPLPFLAIYHAFFLSASWPWKNQSDFLYVKFDRHTKTKKSISCNPEILRVREISISQSKSSNAKVCEWAEIA